jgi:4-amino-4-deoxy-L-arabinose transferase-like glycosyltransferase
LLGERVVWSRFGSWRATVAAAVLELSPMANRWSEQDYFDNMLVLYHH